jgi:hypothetical protein
MCENINLKLINVCGTERQHLGMILDAKAHSQNRGSKRQMKEGTSANGRTVQDNDVIG